MAFMSILLNLSIFMKVSVSAHNSNLDRETAKILTDANESKRTKLIDWHYPLKSQSISRYVNQNAENLCRKNILCCRSKGSNAADLWCARTWIHYQNKSASIQWISQNFGCRKKSEKVVMATEVTADKQTKYYWYYSAKRIDTTQIGTRVYICLQSFKQQNAKTSGRLRVDSHSNSVK